MSKCFGCFFYDSGYMWNCCHYYEEEYFREPNECDAFSIDGNISQEKEDKIFRETNGYFGKPMSRKEEREV